MKLKEKHILDLNEIVNVVSKTQGVIGILLFGSLARGDYDEYSDYDLLVLFENKALMWRSWDELFQAVGGLKLNLHVIPETLEELKSANSVFLNELFRHGKVLFARLPLEVSLQPVKLEPFCLINYDMSGLSYRDKMRVTYFLYRKSGVGAIAKMRGIKFSEGCVLIPSSAADEITAMLNSFNVETKKLEIYASENSLEAWLGQKPTITPKESPINIAQQVLVLRSNKNTKPNHSIVKH
jgi:predicted nucleotidyltransferase